MNELNQELRVIQNAKVTYQKQLLEIENCIQNLEFLKKDYEQIISELTVEELKRVEELNKNAV